MNDWQEWLVVAIAIWCAFCVVRDLVKPFRAQAGDGCVSGCGEKKTQTELLTIDK